MSKEVIQWLKPAVRAGVMDHAGRYTFKLHGHQMIEMKKKEERISVDGTPYIITREPVVAIVMYAESISKSIYISGKPQTLHDAQYITESNTTVNDPDSASIGVDDKIIGVILPPAGSCEVTAWKEGEDNSWFTFLDMDIDLDYQKIIRERLEDEKNEKSMAEKRTSDWAKTNQTLNISAHDKK